MIGIAAVNSWTHAHREHFASQFVGIPWGLKGSCWDYVDCFGLLRFFYSRLGVVLPPVPYEQGAEDDPENERVVPHAEAQGWRRIKNEEWGDVVLIRNRGGKANHIGIVIDGGRCLNCMAKTGVVISQYTAPPFSKLVAGFYRHRSRV